MNKDQAANASDEGYQKAKRYYNNTTQDDLENPEKIGIDGESCRAAVSALRCFCFIN